MVTNLNNILSFLDFWFTVRKLHIILTEMKDVISFQTLHLPDLMLLSTTCTHKTFNEHHLIDVFGNIQHLDLNLPLAQLKDTQSVNQH